MAKFVRYNEVSLYRGTFVYIILHWGKNNLSLYGGSAVFLHASERPVADIDLQRMGGGGSHPDHPDPAIREGGRSQTFFGPSDLSLV